MSGQSHLALLCKLQKLLHLDVDIVLERFVLVCQVCEQSLEGRQLVRLNFLLAERHTYVCVLADIFLCLNQKLIRLRELAEQDLARVIIIIFTTHFVLVFLQRFQVLLEACQLTLDFDVGVAQFLRQHGGTRR